MDVAEFGKFKLGEFWLRGIVHWENSFDLLIAALPDKNSFLLGPIHKELLFVLSWDPLTKLRNTMLKSYVL